MSLTLCKTRLFINSRTLLNEKNLHSNKELKMIMKKWKRLSKSRRKRERMLLNKQTSLKWKRLKILNPSKQKPPELRVNGKQRLKLSLIKLMRIQTWNTMRSSQKQSWLKPRLKKKHQQGQLKWLLRRMPIKQQQLQMLKKILLP
jgi:hypothetical protein